MMSKDIWSFGCETWMKQMIFFKSAYGLNGSTTEKLSVSAKVLVELWGPYRLLWFEQSSSSWT